MITAFLKNINVKSNGQVISFPLKINGNSFTKFVFESCAIELDNNTILEVLKQMETKELQKILSKLND